MAKRTVGAAGGAAAALALATVTIGAWEGLSLTPYWDIAHVRSYCRGETANVEERRYTVEECDALLHRSVAKHGAPVIACTPPETPIEVEAAFVSLAYNIGPTAFCSSSAARFARAGQWWSACNAIGAWNKVRLWPSGKLVVSKGLSNRRAAEMALCRQGLPA